MADKRAQELGIPDTEASLTPDMLAEDARARPVDRARRLPRVRGRRGVAHRRSSCASDHQVDPAVATQGDVPVTVRVGINGFGRIGRNFFRAVQASGADIEIVAANDLGDIKTMAHLLKYDSILGRYPAEVSAVDGGIKVGGKTLKILAEKDPAQLPWKDLGVDVVVESTGFFTDATKAKAHLDGGAKKVIISAPGQERGRHGRDGRQPRRLRPGARTTSSPTRRAPRTAWRRWPRRCNDEFGIVKGLMTTIHAYTAGPEPPGRPAQGPAPGPRRRHQHGAHLDRRRQGDRPGAARAQGQARRLRDARAGARPARRPT